MDHNSIIVNPKYIIAVEKENKATTEGGKRISILLYYSEIHLNG